MQKTSFSSLAATAATAAFVAWMVASFASRPEATLFAPSVAAPPAAVEANRRAADQAPASPDGQRAS